MLPIGVRNETISKAGNHNKRGTKTAMNQTLVSSSRKVLGCLASLSSLLVTMPFGQLLEEYQVPQWRGHYIPYGDLRKGLADIVSEDSGWGRMATRSISSRNSSPNKLTVEQWLSTLESEADHVGAFLRKGLHGLEEQLHELNRLIKPNPNVVCCVGSSSAAADPADPDGFLKLRILETTSRISEGLSCKLAVHSQPYSRCPSRNS